MNEEEKKGASEPPPRKIVLNDSPYANQTFQSPLIWVLFLLIPVALAFYLSLRTGADAPHSAQAVKELRDDVPVTSGRGNSRGGLTEKNAQSVEKIACDFQDWVGKPVNDSMLGTIRALNRPYRILSPGSAATNDHVPERVNFEIDTHGVIARIRCG